MYINKLRFILFLIFVAGSVYSQNRVPPPPCYANNNTGAGGVIGNGGFLHSYDAGVIEIRFSTDENVNFNDILVIYLATDIPGRNSIDSTVDDSTDPYRIAISNSNVSGFGSTINFPQGFEASYAIAVDVNSGGLYSIPNSGTIGDGGLNYISSVNSTLASNSQIFFEVSFNASDIGLTNDDSFYFVATYVGADAYSYDEGYGDGITPGTQGADDINFNGVRLVVLDNPGCPAALNVSEFNSETFQAKYFNNNLHLSGINGDVSVRVYNVLGQEILSLNQYVNDEAILTFELPKNQLQIIVLETDKIRKTLKIIPRN